MDTKKAIAEAAREMLRIANEAGRSLKDFKNSSLHSNDEIRRESEALCMATHASQTLGRVFMDCCWAIKSYVPETRLESHIAPNGYVMRSMVKAPQIVEIEAFEAACNLLIQKYTTEAGWAHGQRFSSGTLQMKLVKLTCSSCGKPSYARSAGDLKYGETLCASCLSLHLAKSH
jgi:hypothetical protein